MRALSACVAAVLPMSCHLFRSWKHCLLPHLLPHLTSCLMFGVRGRPGVVAMLAMVAVAAMPVLAHAAAYKGRDAVTLNFPNADVDAVARAMAAILGRDIVVDPRVKGNVTLYTQDPVSPAQAQAMFVATLRGAGYAVVDAQGLLKVLPEAEARVQAGVVQASTAGGLPQGGAKTAGMRDQVATQVFKVVNVSATGLVATLRPLIGANGLINVDAASNSLVVTDYLSNMGRLQTVLAALDTPGATDVEAMPLHHAMAAQMAYTVQKLVDEGGVGGAAGAAAAGGGNTVKVLADPFSNSLLVKAPNQARLAAVRSLVARLDQAGAEGVAGSNVHVIYLKYAEAVRLAPVLRASFSAPTGRLATTNGAGSEGGGSGEGGGASGGASGAGTGGASAGGAASSGKSGDNAQATAPAAAVPQPVTGGYIQADPASNALIVTAPEALFRPMQAVIAQLDTPRAQVYVESLVVEVDASRSYDVGVKWQEIFNISKSTELTLGTIASAVAAQSGTNILSTANVVTLDNEEARIVVGQNVPFVTGSYTSSSSGSTNPFQTIERKDVGITLRIKPQIGADGRIRMSIYQESSSVSSTTVAGTSNAGPTTNTRSIDTHVVVQDGHIIVLGGLIEDSDTNGAEVMPGMWKLPILGGLFRDETKSRSKRNLVVFLRPHVMRDDAAADALSLDRYALIRASQQALPSDPMRVLQAGETEPAPELPAKPGMAQ
jgi:general secretion pathway protein D